ncbi:hypothetical protein TURU_019183 [Turdus rufiventris]|nr:hypothetical protein TURU_019183 [Turdus rufiventris]
MAARLNNPTFLSHSSQDLYSTFFSRFAALLWMFSSTPMSILDHSCGLSYAEDWEKIPGLVLLATLFLVQARMPLAYLATWSGYKQNPALGLVEPHTTGLGR